MKFVKIANAELVEGYESTGSKYSRAFWSLPVQLLLGYLILILYLL